MRTAGLLSNDGRRWLAAALSRHNPRPPQSSSWKALADESSDAIVLVEESLRTAFDESLEALWQDADHPSTFMVLVPRRDAPLVDPHYGDPVTSFVCSPQVFRDFLALQIDCWPQSILFAMLRAIAGGDLHVDRLLVRQLPARKPAFAGNGTPRTSVVMPHRGEVRHLRAALRYLSRVAAPGPAVSVGLDTADAEEYRALVADHPDVAFFQSRPAPLGPYVIRQALAQQTTEPLISLQDSDDLSCHDRFAALAHALDGADTDLAGSHELCLDEIRVLVYPVRYPLDASGALARTANHALLHATLMVRRDAFFSCGGLSTHLVIANDTQFLLRAFFSMKMRNVDEFLYIRRRHPTSLTNAPETVYDNPLRRSLSAQWSADFEAIKRGELRLPDSSLRPIERSEPYTLERILPEAGRQSATTA